MKYLLSLIIMITVFISFSSHQATAQTIPSVDICSPSWWQSLEKKMLLQAYTR